MGRKRLLRIDVGLGGRHVTVTVPRNCIMLDVASQVQHLCPEFEDAEIKVMSSIGERIFEMNDVVTNAIFDELCANGVRAVMLPGWKAKVDKPRFNSFDCDCKGTCSSPLDRKPKCYGQNFLINMNLVHAPLYRGRRMQFTELLGKHDIINEGIMGFDDLLELRAKVWDEVVSSCYSCGKLAFTKSRCFPHDNRGRWQRSKTGNLRCWNCCSIDY